MAVSIRVESLTKTYAGAAALAGVSLAVEPGELFFLLGPSGCGKTTLLRCIAGFCEPDAGRVFIGDEDVTRAPAHRRDTGMVFQSYALWPHMTVAQNVAFGLEMRRVPRAQIAERVREALRRVRMDDRGDARPHQLSGGQQQRVALARALVIRPRCLLLDEPLSNLDAGLRVEMRSDIRRICKEAGLTAVYVTHDQKEALSVADRIAVLQAGRVRQVGDPRTLYRRPASRFVAGFIGETNVLPGRVERADGDGWAVSTPVGRLIAEAAADGARFEPGAEVGVCIRPESLRFDPPPSVAPNRFEGQVRETVYLGELAQHRVAVRGPAGETELKVFEPNPAPAAAPLPRAARLWVDPADVVVVGE